MRSLDALRSGSELAISRCSGVPVDGQLGRWSHHSLQQVPQDDCRSILAVFILPDYRASAHHGGVDSCLIVVSAAPEFVCVSPLLPRRQARGQRGGEENPPDTDWPARPSSAPRNLQKELAQEE